MSEKLTVKFQFPGESEWIDATHLVRSHSKSVDRRLMNANRESIVDSFNVRLKYDGDITNAFFAYDGRILVQVSDDEDTAVFTGCVAPTFKQRTHQVVDALDLELLDNSYLLDEKLSASFCWPATVGGTPLKILDSADTDNSIVHKLLVMAGYPLEIVSATCPQITTTVVHIAKEAGEQTYREILDTLLSEYRHVFRFTKPGLFTVHSWAPDAVTPTVTIRDGVGTVEGLHISKGDLEYDGFKLEYAAPAVMTNALVYREDLPESTTAGEVEFTGQAIAAGDYFPSDGDIEDTYQSFVTTWLDKPYLTRKSRKKNKDLSLIASSGHSVLFTSDDDVDIYSQAFEAARSKVLFKNTGAGTENIYTFEIRATVLYRKARKYITVPEDAVHPEEYTAEHLYDGTNAGKFANARWSTLRYGDFEYSWQGRDELEEGTVVTINPEKPSMSTTAVIVRVRHNFDEPMWSYEAIGIAAYETFTSVATGSQSVGAVAMQASIENALSVAASFKVLQDGYTQGGGTTTPTVPTITQAKGVFKGALLQWDSQTNLTNPGGYDLRVALPAESTWYELRFDLVDWKGDAGEVTAWPNEFLSHPVPLGADADGNATEVTLHYQVRRRTKSGVVSSWSSSAEVTALAVDSGDYAANSLGVNVLKAGVISAREMVFADDDGTPVYDGWDPIPDGSELFDLRDPSCLSHLHRAPTSRSVVYVPGHLYDELGNEYDNPAALYAGIGCIGVHSAAANLVADPEDLTTSNWTGSNCAAAESSKSIGGHALTLLTASASNGYLYQTVTMTGDGTKCVHAILGKGTGTPSRLYLYDATAGTSRLAIAVTWSTKTVAAVAGTLVFSRWIGDDIVEIWGLATGVVAANTNRVWLLPDYGGTGTLYATAVMVAESNIPLPYAPTSRVFGTCIWPVDPPSTGTVELDFFPYFTYDYTTDRYVWALGAADGSVSNGVGLRYSYVNDRFESFIYVNGSNARWKYGAAIANNAALWVKRHFKLTWDIPNQTIRMWIDGVEQTTASNLGTVSSLAFAANRMSLGLNTATYAPDGLYFDLLYQPGVLDYSTTHYDNAVPWYDPAEVANTAGGVRINQRGIRRLNAVDSWTDSYGRETTIDAMGLEQRDAAGAVIFQSPTAPLLAGSYPMGRLFLYRYSEDEYRLVATSSPTIGSWVTGVQAIGLGNKAINGARLQIRMSAGYGGSEYTRAYICFRPTGSSWVADDDSSPTIQLGFMIRIPAAGEIDGTCYLLADIPLNEDGQFDYYFRAYPTGSSMPTYPPPYLALFQTGVWI